MTMNTAQFKEKHGEEALAELIENQIIAGMKMSAEHLWLKYAMKHKLCGKGTKTMMPNYWKQTVTYEWKTIDGIFQRVNSEEPIIKHTFVLINGRNLDVLRLEMTDEEYKHYSGE